jgi:hypothetical protein
MFDKIKETLHELIVRLPNRLTLIHNAISSLSQDIGQLRLLVLKTVPSSRLVWVYGTAIENYEQRISKVQIHTSPEWCDEGSEIILYIQPMTLLSELVLETIEPFLITEVYIGNVLQSPTLGASRIWRCRDKVSVGNKVIIKVKWFTP